MVKVIRRILVCGGRAFANPTRYHDARFPAMDDNTEENKKATAEYKFVMKKMSEIITPLSQYYDTESNWLPSDIIIISGKARGVDSAAIDWAITQWAQWEEYPADWKKYGNRAGPIRNQQMIDEGKPDLVIAFPGGGGTADMVRRSKKAGIPVMEIKYQEGE